MIFDAGVCCIINEKPRKANADKFVKGFVSFHELWESFISEEYMTQVPFPETKLIFIIFKLGGSEMRIPDSNHDQRWAFY